MGKKSRADKKSKRLQEKQRVKAANRALYDSYAAQGNNSKRKTGNRTVKVMKPQEHGNFDCGNLACKRCYPKANVLSTEQQMLYKHFMQASVASYN
jgi:hypothetical protein